MSEPFVEKTQKELGAIITVPKLTDKLLSRPPFRFLHDIVISFMKATSFPEGLYPEEMLDSSNATDKEKKIQFLSLLISAVEAATGQKVSAQPSKIVAGQEADKTNELLQLLASCAALSADKKAAAVKMVKGGAPASSPTNGRGSSATEPSASTAAAQKAEGSKDDKDRKEEERRKRKEEEKREAEEKKKRKKEAEAAAAAAEMQQQQREDEKSAANRRDSGEKRKSKKDEISSLRADDAKKDDDESRKRRKETEDKTPNADTEERRKRHEEKRRREKELAAATGGATGKEEAVPLEESSSPLTRPTRTETRPSASAGKAPPRTKPTHEVVEGGTASSTVVADVIRESKRSAGKTPGSASVADDEVDANDWMRVAEQQEAKPASGGTGDDAAGLEGEARGYLGQQALKAKREQEEAARLAKEAAARTPGADGGTGIVIHSTRGGRSGAAMAESELSKLREQLQLLTKASNPLGRLLEAIYDDIDTMARELEMWRSEARSQALAAADARRQTTESLQEVHAQLQNLEDAINDQILKTQNIRRNVINNDNTIAGMVRMIVNPDMGKR
ncbi:TRAF3-interacting protein 1 [Trypanosoma melophagium]|uniref:TRAF3-interacting protein 1 n=1 Tax=Trypanosoma melophagium TaxID=715481 RepID=UPI00351A1EC0|nr:TRAF3-interacting protein 1 [Trypanosoma melophagium]